MTLAARFAEADGPEIEIDGKVLCQVWRDDVTGERLRVDRRHATTARRQGLVVEADVDLSVAGRVAHRLVLWADTSPESVEIEVAGPTEIRVWNVWSDGEMTHAWLGWSSIQVETDGESTTLTCSDGHRSDADGPDLVVAITPIAD